MEHYVAVIKDDSRALFEYADKKAAMAKFHHEMEYAINVNITTICAVMNENCVIVAKEKYIAQSAIFGDAEGDAE